MRDFKSISKIMLALSFAVLTARAASLSVPAGASISVRMTDALDSGTNHSGETFHATVDAPLMADGKVIIPKGAEAIGRVRDVESSGRIKGRASITVELTALNFDGKSVAVQTSAYQEGGSSRGKQTAKIAGGATLVGTIVGFAAGVPWIGVPLGAAAGMMVQVVRKPGQVQIPSESLLVFTLQSPLPLDSSL